MRVHVVSDVHGNADALARAGDGADALICLGDLLLFVDYADHGQGVLGELFGADAVGRFVALRTARRYKEASDFTRSLWATVDDREAAVAALVRKQYQEMFDAFADFYTRLAADYDGPQTEVAALSAFLKPKQ